MRSDITSEAREVVWVSDDDHGLAHLDYKYNYYGEEPRQHWDSLCGVEFEYRANANQKSAEGKPKCSACLEEKP